MLTQGSQSLALGLAISAPMNRGSLKVVEVSRPDQKGTSGSIAHVSASLWESLGEGAKA